MCQDQDGRHNGASEEKRSAVLVTCERPRRNKHRRDTKGTETVLGCELQRIQKEIVKYGKSTEVRSSIVAETGVM